MSITDSPNPPGKPAPIAASAAVPPPPVAPPAVVTQPIPQIPAPTMPWWVLPGFGLLLLLMLAAATVAAFRTNDATLRPVTVMAIVTLATGAMGFFFGSSMGSAKKDDTIANNSAALATSAPVIPPKTP